MKGPVELQIGAEMGEGPVRDLELARVRRRGESRLLALMGIAVVVVVAVSIAKPWGTSGSISRSTATPNPTASTAVAEDLVPGSDSQLLPQWLPAGPDDGTVYCYSTDISVPDSGETGGAWDASDAGPQASGLPTYGGGLNVVDCTTGVPVNVFVIPETTTAP